MTNRWLVVLLSMSCLAVGVQPQYRDKNISNADNEAVHTLLARYLQRRLQGNSQQSTPPPPSVLFSAAQQQQSRARQAARRADPNITPAQSLESEGRGDGRDRRDDYDDYEDDLEGFEDSDKSRTRINLLADPLPVEAGFWLFASVSYQEQWHLPSGPPATQKLTRIIMPRLVHLGYWFITQQLLNVVSVISELSESSFRSHEPNRHSSVTSFAPQGQPNNQPP